MNDFDQLPLRILIVGESNPYGADPQFALYHLPRNASGNRLREHLGLTDVEYEKINKINLCPRKWSMPVARSRAIAIVEDQCHTVLPVLVLLGAKVRAAFDGPAPFHWKERGHVILVSLPHPSGLNRQWHAPDARKRAVEVLTRVAPEIPWRVLT